MTSDPEAAPPRTPGRPRSRAADEAILTAALESLIERGIAWTSIEQIARRAGVTRATVYRRFPNLTELLVRAIEWEYRNTDPEALNWPDVSAMVSDWADQLSEPRARRLIRRLYGTLDDLPELLRTYDSVHGSHRGRAVRDVLKRARATGQLPPHSEPETLQQVLSGAALQHLAAYPDTISAQDVEAYFLTILRQAGLAAATPSCRPSPSRRGTER
ncbi:TetR/AcrR family transcriptional regulator [Streptomyces sp. NBC_00237]|uniref:TetR/AcrR family transcriptional regulator n=1 Tax=Streptomyces sp. NBC_00237 TaxID=2975687 RepID=UPI002258C48B|nr:TetR/AcrR family transcriptional regulator [Streptomyces sp. NBC_00237]MCX5206525.1 TetR/AcrR family transcriptional regulator [Streptomyces sp. NBC_00237]